MKIAEQAVGSANGPDRASLLHNMSVPPKSVMRYAGLASLSGAQTPKPAGDEGFNSRSAGVHGTPVRFVLPEALIALLVGAGASHPSGAASSILNHLGVEHADSPAQGSQSNEDLSGQDASRQLAILINARALSLPLPAGCVVIPAETWHPVLWGDALSALAVLCKCSDNLWLQGKTPALSMTLTRRQVSLLIPPQFANRLPLKP
jgi:hypothetical protein